MKRAELDALVSQAGVYGVMPAIIAALEAQREADAEVCNAMKEEWIRAAKEMKNHEEFKGALKTAWDAQSCALRILDRPVVED